MCLQPPITDSFFSQAQDVRKGKGAIFDATLSTASHSQRLRHRIATMTFSRNSRTRVILMLFRLVR